ncbi:MAG: DUF2079 domain-containing protein [Polyangiaceae bacterium]|nr:DUF2079 domain-containing protein [Polyangiaceae bacterium]
MIGRIRSQLESVLAVADRTAARVARAATSWAVWPALLGVGFAIAIWTLRNAPQIPKHQTNKLAEPERLGMFRGAEIAIAVVVLIYLLVVVARRVRGGSWRVLDTFGRMNRALAPLAALPLVAWLRGPNVEKDSPKLTLLFAAVIAALVGYGAYSWGHGGWGGELAEQDEEGSRGARLRRIAGAAGRWLAPAAVAGLWAAYGLFFSRLAITNHRALVTRTTDLGYYDNIFYQSIHGRFLGCSFIKAGYHGSAHFDPILALLSPLYLLYPRAEFLLSLQAVWLGQGVVPVYLLAREKLRGRWAAVLLAAMWAAYPALQGANMYEFHSLTLIAPLVVWLLYFYERGSGAGYWITLALLLLCREDVALLMCFVGLAAALDRREGKPRVAWLTIALSLAYFSIVKRHFMTSADVFMTGAESYSFAYYYDEMMPDKSGVMGIVVSLVTNPAFALKLMLEEAKVVFLLQLFLPLAFLPLLAKPGRWMLLYGIVFCLLASRDPVSSIYFQYSAVIFPIAFALTPEALRRIEASGAPALLGLDGKRLARAALAAAVAASFVVSWKFGGIVDNAAFRGGFARVARTLTPQQVTTYAWVREQVAKIPPGASVAATNRLGAHISNRKAAFFYAGSYMKTAEYVFIDEAELKGADLERHKAAVSNRELVELGRLGKMALFKRDPAVKPAPFTPSAPAATGLGNARPPKGRDAGAPPPEPEPRGMEEPDEEPPRSP